MKIEHHPFQYLDWSSVDIEEQDGELGTVRKRTMYLGDIRVRIVEYSAGYLADHWCKKGHVVLCLEGELYSQLEDGRTFTLTPGTSYFVGDEDEAHRSSTINGCKLFIVD
jgi:quercetin dioxygenase-like cupin family protein